MRLPPDSATDVSELSCEYYSSGECVVSVHFNWLPWTVLLYEHFDHENLYIITMRWNPVWSLTSMKVGQPKTMLSKNLVSLRKMLLENTGRIIVTFLWRVNVRVLQTIFYSVLYILFLCLYNCDIPTAPSWKQNSEFWIRIRTEATLKNFNQPSATFISVTIRGTRGADKSLAPPGREQARKHVRDARDFNNIETRAVTKFLFPARQGAEGNPRHSDRKISLFPSWLG